MGIRSHKDALAEYLSNPKICPVCGKALPYEQRFHRCCSKSCAALARSPLGRKMTEEERKAKQKEWTKTYRTKNSDAIKVRRAKSYQEHDKAVQEVYRKTHKEQIKAKNARYYINNKDHVLTKTHEYRENNIDKVRAREQAYRESHREQAHKYYQDHKDELNAKNKQRRIECGYGTAVCEACGVIFEKTSFSKTQVLCKACVNRRRKCLSTNTRYVGTPTGGEHRDIMRAAGILTPEMEALGFHVHHVDGRKDHNVVDNMLVMSKSNHSKLHELIKKEWIHHQDMNMEQLTELVILKYNVHFY